MTRKQVLDQLKAMVVRAGTQQAVANDLHVSAVYLGDVLHGNRPPGKKILRALGLSRVDTYEKQS